MQSDKYRNNIKTTLNIVRLRTLFITLLLLFITLQSAHAQRKKKILVLQSYHQGLEWTDNINKGIQSLFSPLQDDYEVYYEYLDSKRNAGSSYLNKIATFIALKNNNVRYELIITVDNNALSMLNQGTIQFLGDPPVIFAGLNNYTPALIANLKQVTGIVETTDHRGTIDLMRKLHPNAKSITVILDQTPTGNQIRKAFSKLEQEYTDIKFHYLRDFLLTDIPKIAAKFNKNNLIYILTFNRDSANHFISYTEGIEMFTRNTNAPIYGSWDFYLNKGIVGGKITSGVLQGKTAAEMALRVLRGENANDIAIIAKSPTQFMFDHTFLNKHQINEKLLPKESVILNKPASWFEKNKTTLLNLFIILSVFMLIILYFNKRKQINLQAKYAASLEDKVKERTEKLREANKKLQYLSNIDGLSQLYNRRYFDNALNDELQRLQRNTQPLTLMMCDIDYFKDYNDNYGHLAGDECIKEVAKVLQKQCMRTNDTVARYGGEEFTIILPMTAKADAKNIAAKICEQLNKIAIPHKSSQISDWVTISIGVAVINAGINTTSLEIIALADKALYASKHNGRNRFTLLELQAQEKKTDLS